jgi:hypothetical protein
MMAPNEGYTTEAEMGSRPARQFAGPAISEKRLPALDGLLGLAVLRVLIVRGKILLNATQPVENATAEGERARRKGTVIRNEGPFGFHGVHHRRRAVSPKADCTVIGAPSCSACSFRPVTSGKNRCMSNCKATAVAHSRRMHAGAIVMTGATRRHEIMS